MTAPIECGMPSYVLAILWVLLALPPSLGEETPSSREWAILQTAEGRPLAEVLEQNLIRQAEEAGTQWREEYEKLETAEDIQIYQARRRELFIKVLGGFPERTPLNPRRMGEIKRDGFRVEKILFESQPHFYVTAALFLPEKGRRHCPGVLIPCGHSNNGKGCKEYQSLAALMALNGMVALVYDPIDQGERGQLLNEEGKTAFVGVSGHDRLGAGSVLLGQNLARIRIWDGMRALDYLQSRPEVDPTKIGCTGNSGGGTLTSYLMALDDRILAAAPSCYLTNFATLIRTIGPQDAEQILYGQLGGPFSPTPGLIMDHPDFILMRAPKPTLMCTATQDFFDIEGSWDTFRCAKRLYTRMGYSERVDLIENDDQHGIFKPLREGSVRWMARWLQGRDEPIMEPEISILTDEEITCTPKGQVLLMEDARSVDDLHADEASRAAEERKAFWAKTDLSVIRQEIRTRAGIRRMQDIPQPSVTETGEIKEGGVWVKKMLIQMGDGISLPGWLFLPESGTPKELFLSLREKGLMCGGTPPEDVLKLVKAECAVFAADPRGTGPTELKNWRQMNMVYLLGGSFLGLRAEDILCFARLAVTLCPSSTGVHMVSTGNVGPSALHAAFLEPDLFQSVSLHRSLVSWSQLIDSRLNKDPWIQVVHGALRIYDLPDLVKALGEKIEVKDPVDALGEGIMLF